MKVLATIVSILISISVHAQVNGYAQVTAITSTTLTIGSSSETYGTFAVGLPVIIMQMQDNAIGANTGNNSSFGNLSSLQSAGLYEIAHVTAVTRSSGSITQILISSPLANTYSFNSNSSVQLITYPLLGNNFTTTADISAVAWDGAIGGVVALRVTGTLTLNHNITADNAGFRGGAANAGNAGSCDNTTYITAANELNANKGEGFYKATNLSYAAGRAKILTGGGGANSHNGGGGGGSNASGGGEGGRGYGCSSTAAGGLGGITLLSYIGANRAFMGGGGGAGEGNNNFNTGGGNGGGMIIISANQVATTGSGSTVRISANGQTAADVGNDGAGGGGAGGSILLRVNSWSVVATKTLTISANGGTGGNVNDAAAHGGGGGGAQGAIIFSTATPASNITSRTLNGTGGRNFSGGTFADNATGSDNVGIFNASFALLPAKFISFKGKKADAGIDLMWQTVNEIGVNYYEVQRSYDGVNFHKVGIVTPVDGTYNYREPSNESNAYFRVIMHNAGGAQQASATVLIKTKSFSSVTLALAPNPVFNNTALLIESEHASAATIRIVNSLGMVVAVKNITLNKGENNIPLTLSANIPAGGYQVVLNAGTYSTSAKMLVSR